MVDREHILAVGASLALDALTVDVVERLRSAGIRPIVLKGPALAGLYPDRPRTHEDIDLLVGPQVDAAEDVLRELGFRFAAESSHARAWIRREDGVTVDLHRTLLGVGASPGAAWASFRRVVTGLDIGGARVDVFDTPGIALHVALHAAQHGVQAGKAVEDLERAVERLPAPAWQAAFDLAVEVEALPAFSAGLRQAPAGAALAERLGVPAPRGVELALRGASAPVTALGFQRLAETEGVRAKARLVADELVPPSTFMRAVYPVARRGRVGLAASYVWRPAWLLWHAGPALRAWLRARRIGS